MRMCPTRTYVPEQSTPLLSNCTRMRVGGPRGSGGGSGGGPDDAPATDPARISGSSSGSTPAPCTARSPACSALSDASSFTAATADASRADTPPLITDCTTGTISGTRGSTCVSVDTSRAAARSLTSPSVASRSAGARLWSALSQERTATISPPVRIAAARAWLVVATLRTAHTARASISALSACAPASVRARCVSSVQQPAVVERQRSGSAMTCAWSIGTAPRATTASATRRRSSPPALSAALRTAVSKSAQFHKFILSRRSCTAAWRAPASASAVYPPGSFATTQSARRAKCAVSRLVGSSRATNTRTAEPLLIRAGATVLSKSGKL